jgi:hypothetical protein
MTKWTIGGMPAATAPVPPSVAARKPIPQVPWQRLMTRPRVAASTRSAFV